MSDNTEEKNSIPVIKWRNKDGQWVPLYVDTIEKEKQERIESEKAINNSINAVSQKVASNDITQKTMTVPNSTIAAFNPYGKSSGNLSYSVQGLNVSPYNVAGTYKLSEIITKLMSVAHTHDNVAYTVRSNCNCNCQCDCHCGGGDC